MQILAKLAEEVKSMIAQNQGYLTNQAEINNFCVSNKWIHKNKI